MEIRCQIILIKDVFWKIDEFETFGTRKRILRKKKLEGGSCARKRPVVFWTFHTFVCIANQPWTALKIPRGKKIQGNVWKGQNTTGRFLAQLHPSKFFSLKSFSLCQKFQIHEFFRSDVLWKLFDTGFPYKYCYFEPVCLLVKMASKTVIRPILGRRTSYLDNGHKSFIWMYETNKRRVDDSRTLSGDCQRLPYFEFVVLDQVILRLF